MKHQQYILVFIILIFLSIQSQAVVPAWSVNEGNYEYTMNFIGVLNMNYEESIDGNDIIAAFIDGECIGIAKPIYISSINRRLVYLYIYSNASSGTISFQIYDNSADLIYYVSTKETFAINGSIGTTLNPYTFLAPTLSSESLLLTYSIPAQLSSSIAGNNISLVMPYGTDLKALIPTYTTSPNALVEIANIVQTSGSTSNDFTNPVNYTVHSADKTSTSNYSVTVVLQNSDPTDISLSQTTVPETTKKGTQIATISAVDLNISQAQAFSLVPGDGSANNNLFSIYENKLYTASSFNYESQTSYSIRIKTDDGNGGAFEKVFIINILDENDEIPVVISQTLTIPENTPEQVITTVVATDADLTPAFKVLNYSINSGNSENKYSINSTTGEISIINPLDYEITKIYTLNIKVSDGVNSGYNNVVINLSAQNDETAIISSNENSIINKNSISVFPNPFNSVLSVTYEVCETQNVKISIYNQIGMLLSTIVDKEVNKGVYTIQLNDYDITKLNPGVYTVNFESAKYLEIIKIIKIK